MAAMADKAAATASPMHPNRVAWAEVSVLPQGMAGLPVTPSPVAAAVVAAVLAGNLVVPAAAM